MTEAFSLGTETDRRGSYRERGRLLEERQAALEEVGAAVEGVGAEWLRGLALLLEHVVKAASTETYAEVQHHLMEARTVIYEYDQNLTKRTQGQGMRKVREVHELAEALDVWRLTQ